MHRRARHFSAKAAGAKLYYDTRYLTDSDGTALQTLSDRAGTYNATEATSTKRPLVKTGSNGIGGQPVLLFDGTDDDLQASSVPLDTYMTLVWTVKAISTVNIPIILEQGPDSNNNAGFLVTTSGGVVSPDGSASWLVNRSGTAQYDVGVGIQYWSGSSAIVASYRYSQTERGIYRKNCVTQNNVSYLGSERSNSTATANLNIFSRNRTGVFGNGNLGTVFIANGSLGIPLMRRIEHAAGYSFKIACS